MVDISRPLTKEDFEIFCEQVKSIPKTPSRVRVGAWLWCSIFNETKEITKEDTEKRDYGFIKTYPVVQVVLDDKLDPFKYEVDYL